MRIREFKKTSEFGHFKHVMRALLSVPKAELDELLGKSDNELRHRGNLRTPRKKVRKTTQAYFYLLNDFHIASPAMTTSAIAVISIAIRSR